MLKSDVGGVGLRGLLFGGETEEMKPVSAGTKSPEGAQQGKVFKLDRRLLINLIKL